MIDRNVWVYDIETLASAWTYTAINIDTEEIVQYVLHKNKDERTELLDHLRNCKGQIGFNNLNFDYPIIHYFTEKSFYKYHTIEDLITDLYQEAQRIISSQDKTGFYDTVAIKQKEVKIPQLDLFKVWHYNNKARKTSLKALEISMNYPNVMEMQMSHKKTDISLDDITHILEYNLNDVLATYEFYKRSSAKIDLRKSLINTYKIPCINFSDSKIGEQLILKLYCDKTNTNPWDIRKLRTYRESINLNDCILPSISFESKEFKDLLNYFKTKVISNTKGAIEKSVVYKGFKYDYGTGGIHGCVKSGIYESDDNYVIIDADVASLYPNIAIKNEFYIEHLGKVFSEIYAEIIELRMKAKKEGNTTLSDGFKLAANSVYGKSNDENSFLYDPKFTMQITLNGQLLLTMLAESLVDYIPDVKVLQINTDGITLKIPKLYYGDYKHKCEWWEHITGLSLEYAEYSKMWISDVNNYGALTITNKIKNKGRFEVDKVVGSEPAYHKDNSFRIVPLALEKYFVYGIPVEETIKNHTNIYDFCGRQKFTSESYGETHNLMYDDNQQPYNQIIKQQKNVRYYISNKGSIFIKRYSKGTSEMINKGFKVTIFNKFIEKPFNKYDINYSFYIKEAYKEIDNIIDKQLTLF